MTITRMSLMTEEEKKAAETAKAEAEAKAKADKEEADAAAAAAANEDGDDDEGAGEGGIENKIDYEAELKKEKEAREAAEKALAEDRYKAAEKKRKGEDADEDDEDKPLTKKELARMLEKQAQDTEKKLNSARAEELAKVMTTSDSEKNLMLEIHRSRVFPAHLTLQEQLEECYVLANRKKIIGENAELKRALKGKGGVNSNPAGDHHTSIPGGEPKLAPQDIQALKDSGMNWNGTLRRYEKKLPNGDIFFKDPKTKKSGMIRSAK